MNNKNSVRGLLLVAAVGCAALALPCLNDVDTERIEKQTGFDVRSMVEGRYEVNPPHYYEVRIERLNKEIAKGSKDPRVFDDLAVSWERLGKTDAAIAAIESKLKLKAQFSKEDTYRYHANLGTFLAHKALKAKGGPDKEILKQSLAHLQKALAINPDAHFGREAAQIELVRALVEGRREPKYFEHKDKTKNAYFGLAVMGAAQESPDVWVLAARHSSYSETDKQLIYAKVEDFYLTKPFVFPALLQEFSRNRRTVHGVRQLAADLTGHGITYQKQRAKFIEARLKEGRHPDTDPTFWDGYQELPPYKAPKQPFFTVAMITNLVVFGLMGLVIGGVIVLYFILRRRA